MVKTLALLADLHKTGVLPRNFATVNNEEITTWMQQGRAAMTINPFARLVTYNDPAKGRYGGRFKSLMPPMAADLAGKLAFAPTVEFWSLVIPKNAKQKPLAWEMIRALSSKAGTTAMALNGNGPTPPGRLRYGSASVKTVGNDCRTVKGWLSAVVFHSLPVMLP